MIYSFFRLLKDVSWVFGEAKLSLQTTWLCDCELVSHAETAPWLGMLQSFQAQLAVPLLSPLALGTWCRAHSETWL